VTLDGATGIVLTSASGEIQIPYGKLEVTEQTEVGGGYAGGSGITLGSSGNLSMNGHLQVDGTVNQLVYPLAKSKVKTKRFYGDTFGYDVDGLVWYVGGIPVYTSASTTHAASSKAVPSLAAGGGYDCSGRASNEMMWFKLETLPSGCTITNISLLVGIATIGNTVNWTCDIYATENRDDQGLEHKGEFTVEGPTAALTGATWVEVIMSLDIGWLDFTVNSEILVAVVAATHSGVPTSTAFSLKGMKVNYEWTDVADS
jgi:hypothetical protein